MVKVGDIVRVKSGSPEMTVGSLMYDDQLGKYANVVYCDGVDMHVFRCPLGALESVDDGLCEQGE